LIDEGRSFTHTWDYRAKYIVGAVELLQQKADGGEHWLCSLRQQPLDEAVAALCSLPGIGPKVAACIALFSLDQHHAIPVDTHVWQVRSFFIHTVLSNARWVSKFLVMVPVSFTDR
jgi:N-glycosylase/DNA lyase